MRTLIFVLLVVTVWIQPNAAFSQNASSAVIENPPILYTGRLFGYFRWPDQQSHSFDNCTLAMRVGDPTQMPNGNAEKFIEKLTVPFEQRILVGTGDNFAPELFSRTINDPTGPSGVPRGLKDNYVWSAATGWIHMKDVPDDSPINQVASQGMGQIPADNVGCFLSRAGYDAIVPGKYDFYYGAEYLRKVARFLIRIPESGDFHKVRVLAANLTIETTVDNAAPRIPHRDKNVRYSNDPLDVDMSIAEGDQVLPWLREVTISGLRANNDVYLCKQNPGGNDPDDFPVPIRGESPELCQPLPEAPPAANETSRTLLLPDDAQDRSLTFLQPGNNYALCVTDVHPGANQSTYCARFSVATPFFTHPDPIRAPGQSVVPYPEPYSIKRVRLESGETRDVAIFGVVDPAMNEHVGLLNYTWRNTQDDRTTAVKVVDPVVALRQVLQYFQAEHPDFKGLRILLAHMPDYQASALAGKFKDVFHVVVTQGEQGKHTDEHVLVQYAPQPSAVEAWAGAPVVAVPEPVYDSERGGLGLRLHQILLSRQKACTSSDTPDCREEWRSENRADGLVVLEQEMRTRLLAPGNEFDQALDQALMNQPFQPHGAGRDPLSKLQELTASALRKRGNSDIILLQKRDWFDAHLEKMPGPGELQDALDRVFFKGDFQVKTTVTGSVLKQIMADSARFDREDRDDLALFHEINRGLKPLGIFRDSVSGVYFVNGNVVADDQLYSVVASDYVVAGDTGFPALKSSGVGGLRGATDDVELTYISAAVCEELSNYSKVYAREPCRYGGQEPFRGDIYFDELDQEPVDTTEGFTAIRHFLSWASFWRRHQSIYRDSTDLETSVQNRDYLGISLERAAFGYEYRSHNRESETNLARLFSGVTVPGVNDRQSKRVTTALRVRAARGMVFGMHEFEYQSNYLRGQDPSIPKNTLSFEGGIIPRLWPALNENPKFLGLFSLRLDTQLVQPFTDLFVGSTKIRQRTDKTGDLLGKAGMRLENQRSWFETGYHFGVRIHTPNGYLFNPESSAPILCQFGAVGQDESGRALGLKGCIDRHSSEIDPNAGFVVSPINKFEHGMFLNFSINVPLPFKSGLTYTMENRGDVFFNRGGNRDLPIDTRFLDKWSHSVAVPLVGNFSLVPRFEYTYFRNKVNKSSLSAWQQTITLEYQFNWRTGIPWSTALRQRTN